MKSNDPCPRCGSDVILVDPTEEVWLLNPKEYEEDSEVWLCCACNWVEQATEEESLEEASTNLEWVLGKLAALEQP